MAPVLLAFGPLALRVEAGAAELPWLALRRGQPTPGHARATAALSFAHDDRAGVPGPLVIEGDCILGPGFCLERRPGERFVARVADATSAGAAVVAALVDMSRAHDAAVLHAGAFALRGCAVLVLGPSGAGKSTKIAAHPRRAVASNAVLVWRAPRGFRTCGLPFTGHGDAAVREGVFPLAGGLVLHRSGRAPALATATAWVLSAMATIRGVVPNVGLAAALAGECRWRGRTEPE